MSTGEIDTPERTARAEIDRRLVEAGWAVQDRAALHLAAAPGVAVREFRMGAGPADYALFLGLRLAGVIEAKREGTTLASTEAQTRAYAAGAPKDLQVPVVPLPFLYESTGVETWFTNGLDPEPRARQVFSFHRPETLSHWLDDELARRTGRPGAPPAATVKGRMRLAPPLDTRGMWAPQIRAVENLEASIQDGRPRALIQMATGSGKTFTAITAVYRLIRHGGARRVLFLVDRGNLGRQALKEFQAYTAPDDGRKFGELYNVVHLTHNTVDPVQKVVITTIQRLYSILKGDPEMPEELEEGSGWDGHGSSLVREPPPVAYQPSIPPDFFDVVVIDECHRSIYSLWRQVLEYFDASLIGLTATPASHTYAFFDRNVVSEYRHEQAVRDRVNVPFEVYDIRTRVTEEGGRIAAVGEGDPRTVIGRRDRATRRVRWEALDEDTEYTATQVDRSVVVPDQIRTVLRELKDRLPEIFPGRKHVPKTLIFAKSDDHAEDILRILRQEWGLSNEEAVKITYRAERADDGQVSKGASHQPDRLIKSFANAYNPRVAVTVDMIATGTDVKPLECLVFLRTVKSRGLFEQMKGRGVRVVNDADFRAVTPDAPSKTHFVIVDCVGVMEEQKSDPPLERSKGISFERLLELVRAGNRDEDVLSSLAARLDRMDRRLTDDQRRRIESAPGGRPLREVVAGILDRIDPDREEAHARELARLPAEAELPEESLAAARAKLLEEAAAPLAYAPDFCRALLDVRREQEVLLDVVTLDEVTRSGPRADLAIDYDADKALVSEFETFCREHRDQLDALSVLYARPYRQRLTREQLMALVAELRRPPRQWTGERLWAAYERVEADRVRGASRGRLLTDLISLVRHAMGVEADLVSYADRARERYEAWLASQSSRGRTFTAEQRRWLDLIRDRIVIDLEVRLEDFDDAPFTHHGGLGKAWSTFGDELPSLLEELNRELVA